MSCLFHGETPIYTQICEYLKMQILSKNYLPKQKLPSVRDLSLELEVNPNTVQKALAELESIGLIFTERTNGKYVTGDEKRIEEVKRETVQKAVNDFYGSLKKIGLRKDEILQILEDERSKQ